MITPSGIARSIDPRSFVSRCIPAAVCLVLWTAAIALFASRSLVAQTGPVSDPPARAGGFGVGSAPSAGASAEGPGRTGPGRAGLGVPGGEGGLPGVGVSPGDPLFAGEAGGVVGAAGGVGGGAGVILSGSLPSSLDDILVIALSSSPEILEAEAKVRMAHARWNQTRLSVAQAVIVAYHERVAAESAVAIRAEQVERMRKLVETGQQSSDAVGVAEAAYVEARGRVEQARAQLRYLAGIGGEAPMPGLAPPGVPAGSRHGLAPGFGPAGGGIGASATAPSAPQPGAVPGGPGSTGRPPIPAGVEEALAKVIDVSFEDLPLEAALGVIQDLSGAGVDFVLDPQIDASGVPVKLHLSRASVKTVLVAMADLLHEFVFVVRDYGIFVTFSQRAETMVAPTIPEDLPLRFGPR